jgi:Protein of unknown function (DUF3237)
MMAQQPPPELTHIADLNITVAPPIEIGETGVGQRRVIAITGGTVSGSVLKGRVLPAGADFQIIRASGVTELVARYVIEADDGALVYIENNGLRDGPPALLERLRRGEAVDAALIYFRTVPRFETAAERLQFLTRRIFVGVGARYPDRVALSVWMVE